MEGVKLTLIFFDEYLCGLLCGVSTPALCGCRVVDILWVSSGGDFVGVEWWRFCGCLGFA